MRVKTVLTTVRGLLDLPAQEEEVKALSKIFSSQDHRRRCHLLIEFPSNSVISFQFCRPSFKNYGFRQIWTFNNGL